MSSNFRISSRNNNRHTKRGMALLENSMQDVGFLTPITVAADGEALDGSARMEKMGKIFPNVEPIVIEHDGTRPIIAIRTDLQNADDPRARRAALLANRVAELNLDYDIDVLMEDARKGLDLGSMGFDSKEIDELLKAARADHEDADDDSALVAGSAELQKKWAVQPGDTWQLGKHKLWCGDCTDPQGVEAFMAGERAELAPVDPPYNVGFDYDSKTVDDKKTDDVYERFSRDWFAVCQANSERQIVTPGCNNLALWLRWFDAYHWAPWTKSNSMTNGKVARFWCWEPVLFFGEKWPRRRPSDLFDFPISNQKNVSDHPCPKPLPMWIDLIENYSEVGSIIFESFSGSGTTIIAAEKTHRRCRAVEISPEYCAISLERFEIETGVAPTLLHRNESIPGETSN